MIIITKEMRGNANRLELHDAELKDVHCDYDAHRVTIPLKLYSGYKKGSYANLIFEKVVYLELSICEPWGPGIYINELNITENYDNKHIDIKEQNNLFQSSILLNSGDIINIIASKIILD